MTLPPIVTRKLVEKKSLRELGDGRIQFMLRNPLADATIVEPPELVINNHRIDATVDGLAFAEISSITPYHLERGSHVPVVGRASLLKGVNRIHLRALTREFGEIDIFVELTPQD